MSEKENGVQSMPKKGSADNPYTQKEYEEMCDAGTWNGGYVSGMGYVLPEVVVTGSSNSEEDWSFPSFPSIDDSWIDSWKEDYPEDYGNSGGSGGGSGSSGGTTSEGTWTGCGSSSHTFSGSYNVSKAVEHLVSHAHRKSQGRCAMYVRQALEAGGLNMNGHPSEAYQYVDFLPKVGFYEVDKSGYIPQPGDVIVIQPVAGHPHGHIAMYSGSNWISDFVQIDMWGGSDYRKKANYNLFRK